MFVVVSTHLDDAVLSAYSLLSAEALVVTVLAGLPPRGMLGDWDAEGGAVSSRERVLERRWEDLRALEPTGARVLHLDFPDGQYVGAGLLPPPAQRVVAAALRLVLDGAGEVYAPAGIGHEDHALVRDAVLAARSDAVLYADLPYARRSGFELPEHVDGAGRRAEDVELDPGLAAAKIEAMRCYASQLAQLVADFGDFLTPAVLSRERFWRP